MTNTTITRPMNNFIYSLIILLFTFNTNLALAKNPERMKEKILNKFERQVEHFQKLTKKISESYSEIELRELFLKSELRVKSSIKGIGLVNQYIESAIKDESKSMIELFEFFSTENFAFELREALLKEIETVGPIKYWEQMKDATKFNWCKTWRIVGAVLGTPLLVGGTAALVITAIYGAPVLAPGIIIGVAGGISSFLVGGIILGAVSVRDCKLIDKKEVAI